MNERTKERLDFIFGQLYKGVLEPDYVYASYMYGQAEAFTDALYCERLIADEERDVYTTESDRVYYKL